MIDLGLFALIFAVVTSFGSLMYVVKLSVDIELLKKELKGKK